MKMATFTYKNTLKAVAAAAASVWESLERKVWKLRENTQTQSWTLPEWLVALHLSLSLALALPCSLHHSSCWSFLTDIHTNRPKKHTNTVQDSWCCSFRPVPLCQWDISRVLGETWPFFFFRPKRVWKLTSNNNTHTHTHTQTNDLLQYWWAVFILLLP